MTPFSLKGLLDPRYRVSYAFTLLTRVLSLFTLLLTCFHLFFGRGPIAPMSSKYCSSCIQKLPPSYFLKDTLASPTSRVFSTCIQCRGKSKASSKKRAALQSLDPNIQPAKRVRRSNTRPQPTVPAPLPLIPPVEQPPLPPTEPQPPHAPVTVLPPPKPTGFLPTDE